MVLVGDSGAAASGLIAVDPATGKQSIFSNDSQPVNAGTGFYEIPVDPLLTPDGAPTWPTRTPSGTAESSG